MKIWHKVIAKISRVETKRFVVGGIIFCAGLVFGLLAFYLLDSNTPSSSLKELRLLGNYKYISPLLGCEEFNPKLITTVGIRDKIVKYVENQHEGRKIDTVSVYFRDLNNGPWFGVNEKEYFAPASLHKIPLLISVLKIAETTPGLMDKELLVRDTSAYDKQKVFSGQKLEVGNKYAVRDLVERMIILSDNLAFQVLLEEIGPDRLALIFKDLGIDIDRYSLGESVFTVGDYAVYFRLLYNASYLSKDSSEYALEIMTKSQYKDGLVAGLPTGIVVAHKFGERDYLGKQGKQLHDCGIVYNPKRPYILCVMTRGYDNGYLASTIKGISSMVYDYFSK